MEFFRICGTDLLQNMLIMTVDTLKANALGDGLCEKNQTFVSSD